MRGLARAVVAATIVSVLLAVASFGLIAIAPTLFLNGVLRVTIALMTTWVLFAVVHETAGMVGVLCSFTAVLFALLVMLSHHVGWAVLGAPAFNEPELVKGWSFWLSPGALIGANLVTPIGVGGGTILCHKGVPGPDVIGYVAQLSWWPRVPF